MVEVAWLLFLGFSSGGGLTSLTGGVVGDTGGGGVNKVEGSDRAIVLEETGGGDGSRKHICEAVSP